MVGRKKKQLRKLSRLTQLLTLFERLAYEIPLSATIPAAKITTLRGLSQCLQVNLLKPTGHMMHQQV